MLGANLHLFVIPPWVNVAFAVIVFLAALWKGGWRERVIAVALACEFTFSTYVCGVSSCHLAAALGYALAPQLWRPSVDDGAILLICLLCAVRADRYWNILACSVALLGDLCDLAIFLPGTRAWAVNSASLVFSYLLGFTILWGIWSYQRARIGAGARAGAASGRSGRPPGPLSRLAERTGRAGARGPATRPDGRD